MADPLDEWTWRYPKPQGNALRAVTWGNGKFVAVGDNGAIVVSSDAYNWTNVSCGVFRNLSGVAASPGLFAAVGINGTILLSSNGVSWIQQPSGTTRSFRAVAGNPGYPNNSPYRFLAVGDAGTALSSMNGLTWTILNAGTTNNLNGACSTSYAFYPDIFWVVGDNGTILSSSGIQFWDQYAPVSSHLYAVAGNDVQFAAGGDLGTFPTTNYILTSDGSDWSLQTPVGAWFPGGAFATRAMAVGGNQFVAVGDTGKTLEYNYPGVVVVSDGGAAWTQLPARTSEDSLNGVAYGNGHFVAVGDEGGIMASTDTTNWTAISPCHRSAITSLACGNNLCIACATPTGRMYWSFPDFSSLTSGGGADWEISTTNLPLVTALATSGDVFVGVSGNNVQVTTNGFSWAGIYISSNALKGISYANDGFIAVGDHGSIFTSTDGMIWTDRSVPTTGGFRGVAYGSGVYVAVGDIGATSNDGMSWSLNSGNPPVQLQRVVYGNGVFVAAGDSGSPFYSTPSLYSSVDGMNWRLRWSSGDLYAPTLAYGNGEFLAFSGVTPLKSPDGTNWYPSGTTLPWVAAMWIYYPQPWNWYAPPALCFCQGTFLLGGKNGILMQSGNTRVPVIPGSACQTANGFAFSFPAIIGASYRVQASSDLCAWQDVWQTVAGQPTLSYTNAPIDGTAQQFFRAISP